MFNIDLLCLYSQINYVFMIIGEKVLEIRKWFTDRPFNRDLEEEESFHLKLERKTFSLSYFLYQKDVQ